jgi:hypothetical protein
MKAGAHNKVLVPSQHVPVINLVRFGIIVHLKYNYSNLFHFWRPEMTSTIEFAYFPQDAILTNKSCTVHYLQETKYFCRPQGLPWRAPPPPGFLKF